MASKINRQQLVMVGVLLVGVLLAVLNQTLLSPALPSIMADLNVDATTVQWLTSGYSLVEAVIIPLAAYFIGRFTTRQLFNSAIAIFGVGSFLAMIAPNFPVLLLGRIFQAAGTGIAMPMVTTVILLVFPKETRGTAMGIIGLVVGFAPAVGPSVAGLLVDSVGWRMLFGIVAVLSAVVVILGVVALKNYGSFERTTFDKISVVLSSLGLVSLLYGLSTFSSSDNLILTAVLIIVGLVLLGIFVKRQLSLATPMLKVSILKSRKYATAVITIAIIQAAIVGCGVITPLYIQNVCGYSATISGVAMLPGAVFGAVMGLIGGRMFDRFGVRKVVLPGGFVAVIGALLLTFLGMDSHFIMIALAYTVLMMGLQFMMTPLNTWGVNSLPNDVLQHAQSLSNTVNQVAASIGTAVLVSVSALSTVVAPQAAGIEQLYIGDHLAFCAVAVLMAAAFLVTIFFARDKKTEGIVTPSETPAETESALSSSAKEGAQPFDKATDFAAGFSGVTVDASISEILPGQKADPTVSNAMNREPVCILDTSTMDEVVHIMAESDKSGLPVVTKTGELVGFISDGDIARLFGREDLRFFDAAFNFYNFIDESGFHDRLEHLFNLNVMAVATKKVVSVAVSTPMEVACQVLAEKRIKMVPVVEGNRVVGTLSRRNIVRALADLIETEKARA